MSMTFRSMLNNCLPLLQDEIGVMICGNLLASSSLVRIPLTILLETANSRKNGLPMAITSCPA